MTRNGKRVFPAGFKVLASQRQLWQDNDNNPNRNENLCCRIKLQDHAGGSAREARGPAVAPAMLRLPPQAARRTRRSGAAFDLQPGGDLRRVALDRKSTRLNSSH